MVVIGIRLGLVMVVIGINPHRLSPSRYGTITGRRHMSIKKKWKKKIFQRKNEVLRCH